MVTITIKISILWNITTISEFLRCLLRSLEAVFFKLDKNLHLFLLDFLKVPYSLWLDLLFSSLLVHAVYIQAFSWFLEISFLFKKKNFFICGGYSKITKKYILKKKLINKFGSQIFKKKKKIPRCSDSLKLIYLSYF